MKTFCGTDIIEISRIKNKHDIWTYFFINILIELL